MCAASDAELQETPISATDAVPTAAEQDSSEDPTQRGGYCPMLCVVRAVVPGLLRRSEPEGKE